MSMLAEFRKFAVKGNAIDLAVGVIIGGAFGKIVSSIVGDLIMPVIGVITGGVDYTNLFIALGDVPEGTEPTLAAMQAAGVPVFAWGNFLTILLNFVILAFIVFMLVRQLNRLKNAEPPAPPPATPEEVLLLREIRDSLNR